MAPRSRRGLQRLEPASGVAGLTGILLSAYRGTAAWLILRQLHPAGDFPWLLCYKAHRQGLGVLLNVVPLDAPRVLEVKD